eukprot:6064265-Heterocapsa_arctica.AAC.1
MCASLFVYANLFVSASLFGDQGFGTGAKPAPTKLRARRAVWPGPQSPRRDRQEGQNNEA